MYSAQEHLICPSFCVCVRPRASHLLFLLCIAPKSISSVLPSVHSGLESERRGASSGNAREWECCTLVQCGRMGVVYPCKRPGHVCPLHHVTSSRMLYVIQHHVTSSCHIITHTLCLPHCIMSHHHTYSMPCRLSSSSTRSCGLCNAGPCEFVPKCSTSLPRA